MTNTKEPAFKVLESHHSIQIREYPSVVVAEASVQGERKTAIREGFRLIASYIFGGNDNSKKIAMTKPVVQQKVPTDQNRWTVRFFMPPEYKLSDLPKPNETRVHLLELPPQKYVVIRFSGTATDKKLEENLNKLMKYVSENGLKTRDEPLYAFYNPPWTLPFFRRNEILIAI